MPRPSTQTYPDWVIPYKTRGHEIKHINGRYYLYQITSKYDKETKKRRKISKYLGIITEAQGLKEPKGAIIEKLSAEKTGLGNENSVKVCEAGVSEFFLRHMSGYATLLQKHFPQNWQTIIALAYNRLVYKAPMKDTVAFWGSSYLNEFYKDLPLDKEGLLESLEEIGHNRSIILEYCRDYKEFQALSDQVMFVGAALQSTSDKKDKVYLYEGGGEHKDKSFENDKDSTIWIFSLSESIPVYYRNLPCQIKDVKSLEISWEEFGNTDCICVINEEIATQRGLEELKKHSIRFIAPLSRKDAKCDYSRIGQDDAKLYDGIFRYQGKTIWYCKGSENGVYMYLDEELKSQERAQYLGVIVLSEEDGASEYTSESLEKERHKFGTLGLCTNATDLSAKEVYQRFKAASDIEPMVDSFNQIPECDRSLVQDRYVKEGYSLIRLIALQWYGRIYSMLRGKVSTDTDSLNSAIRLLSNISRIRIGDRWLLSETTSREQELLRALELNMD